MKRAAHAELTPNPDLPYFARWASLEHVAVLAERRVDPTGFHCMRVGKLAGLLAKACGHDDDFVQDLSYAARLHDVGKMFIPDYLFALPTSFTKEQRSLMQLHTVKGAFFLAGAPHRAGQWAQLVARSHHERWDGQGYPDRLNAEAIPQVARLTALADVFDALTHDRPYRSAWAMDKALAEIRREAGGYFEPCLVDSFLALLDQLRSTHTDLEQYLCSPTPLKS